jgi:chromosome segregation protein
MRITRLELHGFKSFPDRTTFQFGAGISCVVGPNGSGKSNVVDALKWCVGEQSARSLRGAEMVDVIFAGSTDRKPVGFAEVVLTLQATDAAAFPGEYAQLHELSVGRRLHRTGASEYFVNQTRVRRRDVVELLMDSGIGNNLYSFIEQGQVDKMITATPEDRRSLIDEAAGISRYKARRDESQLRMVETATQLDRAADVLDEMTRQLRVLEQQVLRAARFRRTRALIRQRELYLALAKHHALTQDRRALRSRVDDARSRQDAARREVARRDEDLAERREELKISETVASTKRDEVAELDARIREQDATGTLHERRAGELRGEIERLHLEVQRARTQVVEAEAERIAAETLARTLGEEHAAAAVLARAAGEEVAGARSRVDVVRVGLREAEARSTEARTALGVAEARVGAGAQSIRDRVQVRDRTEAQRLDRERHLVETGKALDAVERRIIDERAGGDRLAAAVTAAEGVRAEAGTAAAAAEAQLAAVERERDAALAAIRAADRERVAARERGQVWARAVEERISRALRQRDTDAAAQRRAAAEHAQRRVTDGLRDLEEELVRSAAERSRAREEVVSAAVAEVTRTEKVVATARDALRRADEEVARRAAELAALTAEQATLERTLQAVGGDRLALGKVLGTPQSLLQAVAPERRAEVARVLGDRASWVVVRDAATLERLRAAVSGELSLWFWPAGTPDPAQRMVWSATLPPGVEATTAGPGFVIEPTGAVHLGGTARLSVAATRAEEVAGLLVSARSARELAERAASEARRGVEEGARLVGAARAAESEARTALRVESDAVARDRTVARRAREEELRAEQAALQARLETTLAAERAEAERWAGDERRDLELAQQQGMSSLEPAEITVPDPEPARQVVASRRGEVARAQQGLDDARKALGAHERAVAGLEAEQLAARAQRERDRAQIDALVLAVQEATAAVRAAEGAHAAALQVVDEALIVVAGATAGVDDARLAVGIAEEDAARLVERRTAAELQVVGARERAAAAVERAAGADRRRTAAEASVARAEGEVGRTREALAVTRTSEQEARRAATEAKETRAAGWDALERARAHVQRLQQALVAAEKAARQQRAKVEELDREVEQSAAALAQSQQDLEVLRRSMEDRYQVSLSAALDRAATVGFPLTVEGEAAAGITIAGELVAPVELRTVGRAELVDEDALAAAVEELEALRIELAAIGEVNLGASAEYRDLSGRVGELSTQRDDLAHALEQIRQAIARLNRECRERFRDTFDRVNEYFQVTYPRLVGGGSARLSLTNDEDLLETGVDIFVQPPGKRLQNLQLLSGGEKAMTAIALLIALFRVKPSPFCVLDEVDAPLDEANGARFNDMLREMSQRSQFLVVTHNRKTMECADTLYGVTMARPGVSRLVSVNLGAW